MTDKPAGWFGDAAAGLCGAMALLLGWRPDEFWNATPAEVALALQPGAAAPGTDRTKIDELLRRFPDDERN